MRSLALLSENQTRDEQLDTIDQNLAITDGALWTSETGIHEQQISGLLLARSIDDAEHREAVVDLVTDAATAKRQLLEGHALLESIRRQVQSLQSALPGESS